MTWAIVARESKGSADWKHSFSRPICGGMEKSGRRIPSRALDLSPCPDSPGCGHGLMEGNHERLIHIELGRMPGSAQTERAC